MDLANDGNFGHTLREFNRADILQMLVTILSVVQHVGLCHLEAGIRSGKSCSLSLLGDTHVS